MNERKKYNNNINRERENNKALIGIEFMAAQTEEEIWITTHGNSLIPLYAAYSNGMFYIQ